MTTAEFALLFTRSPGEARAALIDPQEKIIEVRHYRDHELLPGDVYVGRVGGRVPSHDAVFVDLGKIHAAGWLPLGKDVKVHEGQWVPVRIIQAPQAEKGAKLRMETQVNLPEQVARPERMQRDPPLREMLADVGASVVSLICDDPRDLRVAKQLCKSDTLRHIRPQLHDSGGDLFADAGVDEAISEALGPTVGLPGGGRLIIEPTSAVTAVDVDAGKGKMTTANRHAVEEIARQLRLRQLAGRIVIDFAGGSGRKAALATLREAVKTDPVPVQVAGLGPLGLVELTRNRRHAPLSDQMCDGRGQKLSAESQALAALRMVLRETRVTPSGRVGLSAPHAVIDALNGPLATARTETEQRLRCPLLLVHEPDKSVTVLLGTAIPDQPV